MSDHAIELMWRLGAVMFLVGFFPLCGAVGWWMQRSKSPASGLTGNTEPEWNEPGIATLDGQITWLNARGYNMVDLALASRRIISPEEAGTVHINWLEEQALTPEAKKIFRASTNEAR